MDSVAVLMSSYNGELYIQEQINSILNQSGVDVYLFIRDDGSTDSTVRIIQNYLSSSNKVFFYEEKNIGVGNSFMELLYSIPSTFDYYAFSDQDDVWFPQKIHNSIKKIESINQPCLYVSNQYVTNEKLDIIKLRYSSEPSISYKQILSHNQLSGCTMVWNGNLNQLLIDPARRPSFELLNNRIHDVWVAMVAAVAGTIIYDHNSYLYYRQHSSNVVGVKRSHRIQSWIEKIRIPQSRNGRSKLSNEIVKCYNDKIIDNNCLESLIRFSNYKHNYKYKLFLLGDKSLYKHSGEARIEYCLKVLFNLF